MVISLGYGDNGQLVIENLTITGGKEFRLCSAAHTKGKKIWLTKAALIRIGKHFASLRLSPEYIYCLCKF